MRHTFEINKILIPVDFSDASIAVVQHGVGLAKKLNASVHLLHVSNVSVDVFPWMDQPIDYHTIKNSLESRMNDIVGECVNEKVEVVSEIREGSVGREIIQTSKEINADLIMMSTHGASGLEEFFIGSTSSKVLTSASCPVLTIHPNVKELNFSTIALPIDSTRHTRDKVSEATAIAKVFGAKVHIAALITPNHEEESGVFKIKVEQIEEHFDHNGVDYETKTIHGEDITEMTNNFAQIIDAGLIIIMTEQEASTGLFVGPHAQRIVNHSAIPVLSVTPIGVLKESGNTNPFL